jgi:hypothetical protein
VFGDAVGKAHEKHVTRVLGALGGAVIGHEVQRSSQGTWYDLALRLPNGSLKVVRYDGPPPYRVGQLVPARRGGGGRCRRRRSERSSPPPSARRSRPVMPLATLASPAAATSRRFAASVPGGLEAVAIGLAMALLLPLFAQVADFSPGRDRRFTEAGFRIEGLPPPLLPALCRDPATRRPRARCASGSAQASRRPSCAARAPACRRRSATPWPGRRRSSSRR